MNTFTNKKDKKITELASRARFLLKTNPNVRLNKAMSDALVKQRSLKADERNERKQNFVRITTALSASNNFVFYPKMFG